LNRASMLANLTAIQKHITKSRPHQAAGQGGLFSEAPIEDLKMIELPEFSADELLWRERHALGSFVTGHPLDRYRHKLAKVTHACREERDMLNSGTSARMVVAGLIRVIRTGPRMSFLELDDGTGAIEVGAFSEEAARFAHCLVVDTLVALQIKPRYSNDRSSLQMIKAHKLGQFGPFSLKSAALPTRSRSAP
jgi:DNA polymerase-3 subunit alpha